MKMHFTREVSAALGLAKAKGRFLFESPHTGEIGYLMYPFKVIFRARSAMQPDTIHIELNHSHKSMVVYLLEGRTKLGDMTGVGPQHLQDVIDYPMSPSRFMRLFTDASVIRAWHGRHQVDNTISDLIESLLAAAYAKVPA